MTASDRIELPPELTDAPTRAVLDALAAAGGTGRFVGGAVRDILLGRSIGDVDIATDLKPEATLRALQAARLKAVPTGIAHGTVTAVSDGRPYEITSLRVDRCADGRHADVAFTTDWRVDAARRDLTFNALYCDRDGRLTDPFGGLADLRAGRVRFIGDPAARLRPRAPAS